MRAPDFWLADGCMAKALSPFSLLWRAGAGIRAMTTTMRHPGCKVFCVGNFTIGGAGKTPTAIALYHTLHKMGIQAHFLSRGYGGRETGPHRVDPMKDTAADVGDEPLLLARTAPAWISRDRGMGAETARNAGAEAIILDDGLQNPSLIKDCSFAVVDSVFGIGNGRVIPAGPMRETLEQGLAKVRAIILIGDGNPPFLKNLPASVPVLRARIVPCNGAEFAGRRVLAFAGIARPAKFHDSLRAVGADIVATVDFADHHPFRASELAELHQKAKALNADLVTTEKDLMRLPAGQRNGISTLDIVLEFEAPDQLEKIITAVLSDA
ncbi:tetraacyldisaccharide 4'-kinase [Thalassospira xiamenensis]|jgi:tetraacyldisaccharide 4'-kinase|uniref:Tetraacyldisaccharide 4'-kinase n=1 Tax=Thalassospira xiamenensis TaxID=220697 RepID=A0A367X083_9PROT|nr:tetraacyldisaccharide 4'-kinase [Thalassospira xiamenensis]KZB56547.1 tetraacyldisaccharide 4'-kinase [Thalassospira xiamenensis]MCK2166742.1 tetraacyldisaccharide 4'-kinase [Thalassospira xiamenensis]RCK46420.1 tetraacyldisaccharide 4'-kinase [Thalassospira xiamenensis]